MLSDLLAISQPYLVTGYTDLRQGIDGLAGIIQGKLNLDPYSSAVFLFCGRRRDRIKGLHGIGEADIRGMGTGSSCCIKRLDNGVFRWPRTETEALLLTEQQVRWLTEGLEIEEPKAIKPGKPGLFY